MKAFLLSLLALALTASLSSAAEKIVCGRDGAGHLQGYDSDGTHIYWAWHTRLVKTDMQGRVLAEREVDSHHGDCCIHEGKLYVATQNRTAERRGVFVCIYDGATLEPAGQVTVDFPFEGGIDGITFANGFFYIGEGKPKESEQPYNWVHKFSTDLVPVEKFKVPGKTAYGIQTLTFAHGFLWLGTYSQDRTYQCDLGLKVLAHHALDISIGAFALPAGPGGEPRLMVARGLKKEPGREGAYAVPAILREGRLVLEE